MRDPNDTRDIGPRIGSPLWNYITAITVAGLGALLVAVRGLPGSGAAELLEQPLLWVLAALALLGELKRIVTPGKSGPDAGAVSVTFCFAALLYWGFPVAALLRAVTTLVVALSARRAVFRAAFNAAQLTLSLAAAVAVLAVAGIHPSVARPWVPSGTQLGAVGLAAAAYFACNYVLVGVAAALHSRAPVLATLRKDLPYQAFVTLALLSAAPLVVVVMNRSVLMLLLFLLPVSAIYANAAMSLNREYQALHDHLTGLPNRTLLLRRTAEALTEAGRTGAKCGFLLLDLDRFKEVNDTLGHLLGDGLLQVIAYRLARSVRPGDVVARLGGDEFAVLLPAVPAIGVATEVAARLRASRPPGPSRCAWRACHSRSRPAWASRCTRTTGARWRCSCSGRTWPCTWPRSGVPGWRPMRRARTATPRRGCPSSVTCAAASTRVSSSCTSSPRCSWPPAGPPAWRRCCAGGTRNAG